MKYEVIQVTHGEELVGFFCLRCGKTKKKKKRKEKCVSEDAAVF